ncbi:MAG: fatty acid desaturase [Cyanobacteria bacterium P01_H01_bin.119]
MTPSAVQRDRSSAAWPAINWVNVAFFGSFHLIALIAAPFFFSWSAIAVAVVLHWLFGGIGICLGYHRMLSHRSFRAPRWVEYPIAVLGALAIEGGPIFWVSGHRQHHTYTEDYDKDPYSAERGFWWSHILWILRPNASAFDPEHYGSYARDLMRQPFYCWLDRNFLSLQVPLAVLLYALGGWSFVIYGIFVRSVFLWHATWFVNSATHKWGYRSFAAKDDSRNLWWVALLTYGEGWHNNHHAYPYSAQTGWRWWEIDVTWLTIRAMEKLGMAKQVKTMAAAKKQRAQSQNSRPQRL